jgi:diguanylate cyclase (GGDEF)-like protein/PAS domain S-box-containing protein
MQPEIELLERRLARANSARRQAEQLLEEKSLALYEEAQRREQAVVALQESEERYRLLVQLSPDAILVESEGEIVYANPAACSMFIGTPDHAAWPKGRDMVSLVTPAHRIRAMAAMASLGHGVGCEQVIGSEEEVRQHDGQLIDVAVTRIAFSYRGQPAVQMVARDVSHRKRLENQLIAQATHDALTGLPNRALLRERLATEVASARRHAHAVWVVFIDLDRFKFINDSLGHGVGDMVLTQVAERLRAATGPKDTVARLGGDEFVLVVPDLTHDADPAVFLDGVMRALVRPMDLAGRTLSLTCSVGMARFPDDSSVLEDLVEKADIAMYRAKQQGRNNWQLFTAEMQEELHDRVQIETALHTALAHNELFLHFQPQYAGKSTQVVGVEALLRWRHPTLGIVKPERFIPLAEENGLIVPIGAWVLRTACMQCKSWQTSGYPTLRLAVNLSPRQFAQADFVDSVAAVLRDSGLEAQYLTLELTENLVMADVETSIEKLGELKALGVKLSIDDFGTGYSGLSYLKRFPIDELKIDRSFIRDIADDGESAAIVLAIISLARNLNLRVIAEGVETVEQIAYLHDNGCEDLQGYFFSRPLPALECRSFLGTGEQPALLATDLARLARGIDDTRDLMSATSADSGA